MEVLSFLSQEFSAQTGLLIPILYSHLMFSIRLRLVGKLIPAVSKERASQIAIKSFRLFLG